MSRANVNGRGWSASPIRMVVLADRPPTSAVSITSPEPRTTNFPEGSTSPILVFERNKWAVDVTSRSSPSAYLPNTIKCCEARAPHSVASSGTIRRETGGAKSRFPPAARPGKAAIVRIKRIARTLLLANLMLMIFRFPITFRTEVSALPPALNPRRPSAGSREPAGSGPVSR